MKMKNILVLWMAVGSLLIQSCYKDHTTVDTREISEIAIELANVPTDVLDLDKNETVNFSPTITQQDDKLALEYEWEVDHEIVSREKDFTFKGDKLGSYIVRLKVSNQDGSSFKTFKLNVNSPYEEGLIILGESPEQKATITFIRKYANKLISETKVDEIERDAFAINNDGAALGNEPTDIVRRNNQFFVSTIGNQTITLLNHNTFEVETKVTAPEFPDFNPYRLNIPNTTATKAQVLTKEGKLYSLATNEFLIQKDNSFDASVKLEVKTQFVADMNFTSNYYWDNANSRLWNIWYTKSSSLNEFEGQDLVQFFFANNRVYTLTKSKQNPNQWSRTVFGPYIQEYFATPLEILEKETFTSTNQLLNKASLTLVNDKLFNLLYVSGKSIYQWFYSSKDVSSTPFITIDIPGEITAMERSLSGNELFVAVYDAAAAGNKGSVLVYNIENGRKITSFLNVSDKAVRLLYKKNI